MKENVIIRMFSVQYENDERTESELLTEGFFRKKGNLVNISYSDTEATGFEGSETSVTVRKDEYASIIRKGTSNSNLILERDKKHHCYYSTPFGGMNIGIFTHAIRNELTDDGGTLYMKYTVDINSAFVSDNEIELTITPKI